MKVSELTGARLDLCVAKIDGHLGSIVGSLCLVHVRADGLRVGALRGGLIFEPSANWAHGGPIIERERLELRNEPNGQFSAMGDGCHATGHTMLIAGMRAYVASKFGDEVPDDPALP